MRANRRLQMCILITNHARRRPFEGADLTGASSPGSRLSLPRVAQPFALPFWHRGWHPREVGRRKGGGMSLPAYPQCWCSLVEARTAAARYLWPPPKERLPGMVSGGRSGGNSGAKRKGRRRRGCDMRTHSLTLRREEEEEKKSRTREVGRSNRNVICAKRENRQMGKKRGRFPTRAV